MASYSLLHNLLHKRARAQLAPIANSCPVTHKHVLHSRTQASIVAGSPYYKMLSGLLLGYDPENVRGYVAATSPPGSVNKALVDQVSMRVGYGLLACFM